jgi:hypothetical protein
LELPFKIEIMNASQTNITLINSSVANPLTSDDLYVDQIGKTIARSLDKELAQLSPKVLQRLEKSREIALSQQKHGSSSVSQTRSSKSGFFPKLGPLSPIFIVLLLVFGIAQWQQNARIDNIADVDTAILTDSVPPDAYADDGFRLFLKKMMSPSATKPETDVVKIEDPSSAPKENTPAAIENRIPDISTNQ